MELNDKQKRVVIEAARNWPKTLSSVTLLVELDKLAKAILLANMETNDKNISTERPTLQHGSEVQLVADNENK